MFWNILLEINFSSQFSYITILVNNFSCTVDLVNLFIIKSKHHTGTSKQGESS